MKKQQGEAKGISVSSILWRDGNLAHTSRDEADLLARNFSVMCVPILETPQTLLERISEKLMDVSTCEVEIKYILLNVDEKKD